MSTNPLPMDSDELVPETAPSPRGRWLVVAIAISLVALPLLWAVVPQEISRWYQAAAAESELDDDGAGALRQIDRAIDWNDREPSLYAYRARLKLQQKDLEGALEDCNRAISLAPDVTEFLAMRVLVYQRRGEHTLALRDVEQIVQLASRSKPVNPLSGGRGELPYDEALNLRAYSRALAGREIQQGLEDIEKAFQLIGSEANAAYLDTRGYLRHLAGDQVGAEQDMERAVQLAEVVTLEFQTQQPTGDPRIWSRQQRQLKEQLAVLLHHRGLVYEAVGRADEAAKDFAQAQEYGYSPENGVW